MTDTENKIIDSLYKEALARYFALNTRTWLSHSKLRLQPAPKLYASLLGKLSKANT